MCILKSLAWTLVFVLAVLLAACQPIHKRPGIVSRPTIPLGHLPALDGEYFALASRAAGRKFHFFSPAAPAARRDLGLVVTSGSRDRPKYREAALSWFEAWQGRKDAPWAIKAATIQGGTHAANSANSYRIAMNWLFGRTEASRAMP